MSIKKPTNKKKNHPTPPLFPIKHPPHPKNMHPKSKPQPKCLERLSALVLPLVPNTIKIH